MRDPVVAAFAIVACALGAHAADVGSSPPLNVTVFSLGEAGYFCIKIPYLLHTQARAVAGRLGARQLEPPSVVASPSFCAGAMRPRGVSPICTVVRGLVAGLASSAHLRIHGRSGPSADKRPRSHPTQGTGPSVQLALHDLCIVSLRVIVHMGPLHRFAVNHCAHGTFACVVYRRGPYWRLRRGGAGWATRPAPTLLPQTLWPNGPRTGARPGAL
jgi:hypothetical protein